MLTGVDLEESIRAKAVELGFVACGFARADDYYDPAAAAHVIDRIAVPTFILNAANDPFIRILPETRRTILANPNITFIETADGGHCSYLGERNGSSDGRVSLNGVALHGTGNFVTIADITHRVNAERALKQSEERYRYLIAIGGIFLLLADHRSDGLNRDRDDDEILKEYNTLRGQIRGYDQSLRRFCQIVVTDRSGPS